MSLFDTDKAYARVARMWLRLGRELERRAYDMAQESLSRSTAIELAAMAEACFWQATGESDSFDMRRDFIRKTDEQKP